MAKMCPVCESTIEATDQVPLEVRGKGGKPLGTILICKDCYGIAFRVFQLIKPYRPELLAFPVCPPK